MSALKQMKAMLAAHLGISVWQALIADSGSVVEIVVIGAPAISYLLQ